MNTLLPALLSMGAIACFSGVFVLANRLAAERVVEPSKEQFSKGWLPGVFTPAGNRLRRRITILFIVAWLLAVAGMVLFFVPVG